jgi:hypothetical protein
MIPKLNWAFQNTRNRQRVAHIREINNASVLFKSDHAYFQTKMDELVVWSYISSLPTNPFSVTKKINAAFTPEQGRFSQAGIVDTWFYFGYGYDYYRERDRDPNTLVPVIINRPSRWVVMTLLETLDNYKWVYDYTGNNNYRDAVSKAVMAHLPYWWGPGVPAYDPSGSPYEATQQGYNISGWVFYYIKMK